MNRRLKFWAMVVGACAAASLLAQVAFAGVTWRTPWRLIVSGTFDSFLFSLCCSTLCIVVLPRLAPRIFRRTRAPYSWAIVTVLLALLAAVGSFIAMLIFAAAGFVQPRFMLRVWLGAPLKVSVISTLLFGMFFTVVEHLRARLDAAKLALRTKERDEAEARRLAAEAQLASIESRVQPHFLFNTLNSIAALVHEDPAGAERMTGQLASLLRSSLDHTSTPLIPLDEELRVVRAYLSIEQVRFGSRLRFTIDADEAAQRARVPRLAVQTIVENSVKYAVSPRREGGTISVRAHTNHDHVDVSIEDDGPGFDETAMMAGHGLALVRDRLAMTLGSGARLIIGGQPGSTAVTFSVPLNPEPRTTIDGPRMPNGHDSRLRR